MEALPAELKLIILLNSTSYKDLLSLSSTTRDFHTVFKNNEERLLTHVLLNIPEHESLLKLAATPHLSAPLDTRLEFIKNPHTPALSLPFIHSALALYSRVELFHSIFEKILPTFDPAQIFRSPFNPNPDFNPSPQEWRLFIYNYLGIARLLPAFSGRPGMQKAIRSLNSVSNLTLQIEHNNCWREICFRLNAYAFHNLLICSSKELYELITEEAMIEGRVERELQGNFPWSEDREEMFNVLREIVEWGERGPAFP